MIVFTLAFAFLKFCVIFEVVCGPVCFLGYCTSYMTWSKEREGDFEWCGGRDV